MFYIALYIIVYQPKQLKFHIYESASKNVHRGKSNKMQQFIKILLFRIYMKLNMFGATHRPSSGA